MSVTLRMSPTRAPATAQVAMKVCVPPALRDALARAAVQRGEPMTRIIRNALRSYLGEPEPSRAAVEPEENEPTRGAAEPVSPTRSIREPE